METGAFGFGFELKYEILTWTPVIKLFSSLIDKYLAILLDFEKFYWLEMAKLKFFTYIF